MPGCSQATASISAGATLRPPLMMRSFSRPVRKTRPRSSIRPRSPVRIAPSASAPRLGVARGSRASGRGCGTRAPLDRGQPRGRERDADAGGLLALEPVARHGHRDELGHPVELVRRDARQRVPPAPQEARRHRLRGERHPAQAGQVVERRLVEQARHHGRHGVEGGGVAARPRDALGVEPGQHVERAARAQHRQHLLRRGEEGQERDAALLGPNGSADASWSAMCSSEPWVWTTPFGLPVLPLVRKMHAGAPGPGCGSVPVPAV